MQRLEFHARTDTSANVFAGETFQGETGEVRVSDLSPFIQAEAAGRNTGYFLQFGGRYNTRNGLRRVNRTVDDGGPSEPILIQPGEVHHVIEEFDGHAVRLTVDGETVLEFEERDPLVGPGHEHLGFYFFTPTRVSEVKVHTSQVVLQPNPEWDPDQHDPDLE